MIRFFLLCLIFSFLTCSTAFAIRFRDSKRLSVQEFLELCQTPSPNGQLNFDEIILSSSGRCCNEKLTIENKVRVNTLVMEDRDLKIENVDFLELFRIDKIKSNKNSYLRFDNCTFEGVNLSNIELHIFFIDCNINGNVFILDNAKLSDKIIYISNSQINVKKLWFGNDIAINIINSSLHVAKYARFVSVSPSSYIEFFNSNFSADTTGFIDIDGLYTSLEIADSCKFTTNLLLEGSIISQEFILKDSKITDTIFFGNTVLPTENSIVEWEILESAELRNFYDFKNSTSDIISSKSAFDDLSRTYGRLLEIFDKSNNDESKNACYIAFKNLETQRNEFLYRKDGGIENYMRWKLNVFLETFSDYGTNLAKSVVISIYVIIAFSIFFFFFPSDWNVFNRDRYLTRLQHLVDYLKTPSSVTDLASKEQQERIEKLKAIKQYMTDSQSEIPSFFRWMTSPFYSLSLWWHNLQLTFLKKSEPLKGTWKELSPAKKQRTGIVIFLLLGGYLFFSLFVRILNAVTLSLNSYVTLGFGHIPTSGVAKYMCIIEGFIGWFMLSIFSVTLINQILN